MDTTLLSSCCHPAVTLLSPCFHPAFTLLSPCFHPAFTLLSPCLSGRIAQTVDFSDLTSTDVKVFKVRDLVNPRIEGSLKHAHEDPALTAAMASSLEARPLLDGATGACWSQWAMRARGESAVVVPPCSYRIPSWGVHRCFVGLDENTRPAFCVPRSSPPFMLFGVFTHCFWRCFALSVVCAKLHFSIVSCSHEVCVLFAAWQVTWHRLCR